jgi:hypothetical protein
MYDSSRWIAPSAHILFIHTLFTANSIHIAQSFPKKLFCLSHVKIFKKHFIDQIITLCSHSNYSFINKEYPKVFK